MPYKLTQTRLALCLQKIPPQEISKVFRDAMEVAASVGLQYIWIDSLCIIQDSVDDWIAESTQMSNIYSYGYLNIAADGFSDGSSGLFTSRNVKVLSPIKVACHENVRMHVSGGDIRPLRAGEYFLLDVHCWRDAIEDAPLGRRGWVVQERALSPRTLHFGKGQIFWECLDIQASEVFPRGFVEGTFMNHLKGFPTSRIHRYDESSIRIFELLKQEDDEQHAEPRKLVASRTPFLTLEERDCHWTQLLGVEPDLLSQIRLKDLDDVKRKLREWNNMRSSKNLKPSPVQYMSVAHVNWCRIIEAYTACALSFRKDKLVAIAGMAQMIHREMQCEYLAGLWRKDLEHQLLWKVSNRAAAVAASTVIAPSWSWASVDGTVEYDHWIGRLNVGYNLSKNAPADLEAVGVEVEWLARTVEVDIQRLDQRNLFGQVLGGTLILTGQLGVMRITDSSITETPTDAKGLIPTKLNPEIHWDDNEIYSRFSTKQDARSVVWKYSHYTAEPLATHEHDVFYMPLRVMDFDACNLDYEEPMMQGLLLLPQAGRKGRYRRAGVFTVSAQWDNGKNELIAFRARTEIRDERFFVEKVGHGEYVIVIN